jgi:APA family basic amino acid/polyamine antiporter
VGRIMTASANASTAGRPTVSTITATAIVVADMVGVGVFTSLGFQVKDIASGFALILLWVVGGVVALCGAAAYSELAGMFPRSSGEYNFLARTYHPAVGFLAGWLSATVGFSAPIALAAMAFGEYAKAVWPGVPALWFGVAATWVITLVHLRGVRSGSLFHNVWTVLKLALIIAFLVAGALYADPQPISFAPSASDIGYVTAAPFAISLVFVMYSYSGWNAATYIAGEIHDPQRSLPRALLTGTLVVLALYVGLNWVFLRVTPIDQLAGQLDVAVVAGRRIFGETGGAVVGGLICLGLVSSISAMTWIGPRVTMTMGEDIPMLRFFARTSKSGVPVAAILFQLAVVNLMLLSNSFEAVLDFIQFSLTACSFLAVAGVIWLRLTRPDLPRPYRAWGYPVTPALYLLGATFFIIYIFVGDKRDALIGIGLVLVGLPAYAWFKRGRAAAA